MNDIVAINRQLLTLAKIAASSKEGGLVTGLPDGVLQKIAALDIAAIEALARHMPVSLMSFRLDETELDRLIAMPEFAKPAYAISVVSNKAPNKRASVKPRTVRVAGGN